jgi:hypothetical protein
MGFNVNNAINTGITGIGGTQTGGDIVGKIAQQGNMGGLTAKKCGCPNESPATQGPKGPEAGQDKGMEQLKDLLGQALQMLKQIMSQLEQAKGAGQNGGAEKGAPKGPDGAEGGAPAGGAEKPAGGAEGGQQAGGAAPAEEAKKEDDKKGDFLSGLLDFLTKLLDILKTILPQLQQLFGGMGGGGQAAPQAAEAA